MTDDLLLEPAIELARMVRDRRLSAVELLDLHLARIGACNPELNAIVLPRPDEARAEALAADRALASGAAPGPLHGLPFTAKDSIAVAGMPRPNGSRLFDGEVTAYDAPAIRRLRSAGAVLVGKTNVPEFAAFYDTANDVFGATRNPHDTGRSAGGSSGGEAVAVATGMAAFGLGSDLGSSVRNPAHFTGVFGLKPSRTVSPCLGHAPDGETPLFWLLAVIGPLTRAAGDLALVLDAIAETLPAPSRPDLGVVGVYEDDVVQPVSADCRRAVRSAAAALADAGHTVVEDRPPHEPEIRRLYDELVGLELGTRFAGLTAGREHLLSRYGRMAVASAPREPVRLAEYLGAWTQLSGLARDVDEWFERRRLALCPVTIGPAPPIGEGFTAVDGEPVRPGGKMALATLANALGLPAAAVPVLRTNEGLPVGVQVMGARGRDREVVDAARTLEAAFGGQLRPPPRTLVRARVASVRSPT